MIIMIIQEEMSLLIIEHYLTKKLNISQKNIQRLLLNLKNFQMYICFRQFLSSRTQIYISGFSFAFGASTAE